jgi:Tol biopolymer transport system component
VRDRFVNRRNVTGDFGGVNTEPAFSWNGNKIAFCHATSTTDPHPQIWKMDDDGDNKMPLTGNSKANCSPTWSPDGDKIAFDSAVTDNDLTTMKIFKMNANGHDSRPVISSMPGADPYWGKAEHH